MNQSDLNLPASHADRQRNLRMSDNGLGRNEVQPVQGDTMATSFQDPPTHFSIKVYFSIPSEKLAYPKACLSQALCPIQG